MASGLRKARVLSKDLPPVIRLYENVYGYLTRHRVISEDRNRFSAWSSVTDVPLYDAENLPSPVPIDISISGDAVTVVWDDEEDRPSYDIFVSEDGQDFYYHGTTPIHTYSFLNTASETALEIAIQVASINRVRENVLTIAQQSVTIGS
jgi:hypothetical protein